MISIISIGLIAMIITCKDDPLAVILPLERVTTANEVAGEKHIAFSLSNPNSRAMQVTFSISPEARTASYSAGGSRFNSRSLEFAANENKSIRITGLRSSQEYTITIMNSENVGNPDATNNTVITVTTTADMTPPNPVRTDREVAGEQHIAFLLINVDAEAVQVAFSLSPAVSTASYMVDETSNPLSENVELAARREAAIRIEGLASSTVYTITMTTTDNAGNANATNTIVSRTTSADGTPPVATVTTDDIEPGGDYIAFSLMNPNAEAVQVTFIRTPTVITASYSVDGTPFDHLSENVDLGANESKVIRIEGLASLTEYTIIMRTTDTNANAHANNTEITATTTADVTPPAEPVVKSNVQPGGKQIAFILTNPNTEEVQVAFSLSPAVSTASYNTAGGTSFEPTNLMLAPRNAQRIIIGGLKEALPTRSR